jgi:hypothetical protein
VRLLISDPLNDSEIKNLNATSVFGSDIKTLLPISHCLEEAPSTVPTTTENPTPSGERLAALETTAVMGKRALGALAALLLGFFSFFYVYVIPDRVEQGISNSNSLNTKFTEVRDDVKKLDGRFEQLISTIRPLVTPKIVAAAMKESASVDEASLPGALAEIRNLLSVVREMKVPLRSQDYNETSQPLFKRYVASKPPLRQEIWGTLIDLAATRTRTDGILHKITDAEIAKAKAAQNYLEGDVDLSKSSRWDKTIFRNCKITISKPNQDLVLSQVRFVDDDFQLASDNDANHSLLESVLASNGPEVTATVVRFKVLPPVGNVDKVVSLNTLWRTTPALRSARILPATFSRKYQH